MVKGITRQVVWVKGNDEKLFEEAFFLVKDEAIHKGEITEERLLKEAKELCSNSKQKILFVRKILWAFYGAITVGMFWLLSYIY